MTDAVPAWTSDGPEGRVEVLDDGALVLRWQPAGHDPVLFVGADLTVEPGVSPHAGVPVCWPWFGRGDDGTADPSHGLVRTARWQRVDEIASGAAPSVTYRVGPDDVDDPRWPGRCVVSLTVAAGRRSLTLSLTTTNHGPEPVAFGEALHAYLAVGDVRSVVLDGLDGAPVHDKVTGADEVHTGALRLTGETDRVFRSQHPVTVVDPVLGRRLVVETDGARHRVVWNPWQEKGSALGDVGEDWSRFVCVEGATVDDDGVRVEPGSSHTLTYRITVEDL